MSEFKLSNKAVSDLMDIGRFTEENWGVTQRNLYLKQIDDCFHQLVCNPDMGVKCDYIRVGYRKIPQGSHLIFYRQGSDNLVEIIRILHKSMDFETHF